MFQDNAFLGPVALPNILICALGFGQIVYWTRGRWSSPLGALKGFLFGGALLVILTMMFACMCSEQPTIPFFATLAFSTAFFGSRLDGKIKTFTGWLLAGAFISYGVATFFQH